VFGIHDNTEDFPGDGYMEAKEVLGEIIGNLPLFTLCKGSSIAAHDVDWGANRDEGGIPSASGV
jgi:hypothetical protein